MSYDTSLQLSEMTLLSYETPKSFKPCNVKTTLCICENKSPDQLNGNYAADQRVCCRFTDRNIPLHPRSIVIFCGCTRPGFLASHFIVLLNV